MGFHTFTAGEVLTAANVNSFLMNQTVIVCTSGTRPASPVAGMTVFETDTGLLQSYSGTAWVPVAGIGAWTTYSPTWTTGTTQPIIGNGTITGRYRAYGKTVFFSVRIDIGSTTTGGSGGTYGFSLPVTANASSSVAIIMARGAGNNTGVGWWGSGSTAMTTNLTPTTFAAGDTIIIGGSYESQ